MRLVVRNRYGSAAGGLRRYKGSGIFSSIGRKLFSSGLKKVINVATKANLPQKIANVVVNGAQSAGQKFGKTVGQKLTKLAGEKLGKIAGEKVAKSVKETLKRKFAPEQQLIAAPTKQAKIDVNHLIDGSGIFLD
jgi:hypothetical protein